MGWGGLIGMDMYYSQDICMIAVYDAPAPTEAEKKWPDYQIDSYNQLIRLLIFI